MSTHALPLLSILEHLPSAVSYVEGRSLTYKFANRAYIDMVGNREILGKPFAEAFPETIGQGLTEKLTEIFDSGSAWSEEAYPLRIHSPEGTGEAAFRYFHFTVKPIHDEANTTLGLLTSVRDVTDAVLEKISVENTSEHLTTITDSLPAFIAYIDKQFRYQFVNRTYRDFFDRKPSEILGKKISEILPEAAAKQAEDFGLRALNGSRSKHLNKVIGKTGDHKYVDAEFIPDLRDDGVIPGFFVLGHDVTARIHAEENLAESELKFRSYTEAMPQMAFIANAHGDIIYFNQNFYDFVGLGSEISGWNWKNYPIHHPDDLDRTIEKWTQCLKTGQTYEIEYRLRRYDGAYFWYLGRAIPVRNKSGEIAHWFGTNTDIHHAKLTTEKLAATAQELGEALELRNEFLSIASHELKTPLTSLKLQLQLSRKRLELKDHLDRLSSHLEVAERQTNRLSTLVEELLDVSVIESGKLRYIFDWMDLSQLMHEVLERFQLLHPHLALHIPPQLMVKWDSSRIEQVLVNLLTNAQKYAPDSKVIVSATADAGRITLRVKDFGPGITPERQKSIFDKFERAISSKNVSGLGLGLYIVKNIVAHHQGTVAVNSGSHEAGSEFILDLPVDPTS